jgi:hypothetical protein
MLVVFETDASTEYYGFSATIATGNYGVHFLTERWTGSVLFTERELWDPWMRDKFCAAFLPDYQF